MHLRRALSVGAALLAALPACSKTDSATSSIPDQLAFVSRAGGALRIAAVDFPGLHPLHVDPDRTVGEFVADLLFEGLTSVDAESGEVEGDLASEWTASADGLEWRFVVDEGHGFTDGSEVDADAVVSSLGRALADGAAPAAVLVDTIDSVEADGDVVVIHTKIPNMELPALLAAPSLGVIKGPDDSLIGSGDWQVAARSDEEIRLEPRRPDELGEGSPSSIVLKLTAEFEAAQKWFDAGDVDLAPVDPTTPEAADRPRQGRKATVVRTGSPFAVYAAINTGVSGLDDPSARRAVGAAINRAELATVFGDLAVAADLPVDATTLGLDACSPCQGDRASATPEAVAAVNSASTGGPLPLDVVDGVPISALAQPFADAMTALGVPVQIRAGTADDVSRRIASGESRLILWGSPTVSGAPLTMMHRAFSSEGTGNVTGVRSSSLDDGLLAALELEPDADERSRRAADVVSAWDAAMPALPIALVYAGYRVGERVTGGVSEGHLSFVDVRVVRD